MVELTDEDRVTLARMVTSMLDEWGIKAKDQVNILALPDGTPTRMLRRYQDDTPLPDDPVEAFCGIFKEKSSLTSALAEQREKDKHREEKKIVG